MKVKLFATTGILTTLPALLVVLSACGSEAPTPPPTATTAPAQTAQSTTTGVPGRDLYLSKGCAACHGQNAEGSTIAPALPGHNEAMVKRQVRNPRFQMPAFSQNQISDEELDSIANYIESLKGQEHGHRETIELTAAVEMHHWMALESLKVGDPSEASHHVGHIIELLQPGQHLETMQAILEGIEAGKTHDPEHDIEQMLAGTASPDLTLVQLHLRQGLVALAVDDTADAEHHVAHAQSLADEEPKEGMAEVLDLLGKGDVHGAEHEMQELLGEEEGGHGD